ncbi:MAG: oligosaccharide flippase family protein [Anaerolineales bacterium]|nr:oligosaccharide flippase family protein [Anaerolineales bacterium]
MVHSSTARQRYLIRLTLQLKMRSLFTRFQADLALAALLFILPLILFWQVTVGGRTLIPGDNLTLFEPWKSAAVELGVSGPPHNDLVSDLVLENYLWKKFTIESAQGGEIPLWNPHLFTGVPFLAAGQHSALYPFSILYYVLPLSLAYGWFTVSQLWLAGVLMYVFLRVLGLHRYSAVFGAVLYELCGFMTASVVFQMIIAAAAWLPLVLTSIELIARQQPALGGRPATVPWVALGAVGVGMQLLAGHVEITYYTLMVSGAFALWRLAVVRANGRPPLRVIFRRAIAMLAVPLLGVALGAVQFVPLYELASNSFRTGRATFDEIRGWAFPLRHALIYLIPNFYGSPAHHNYLDLFSGQWQAAPLNNQTIFWGIKNYVEGATYLGVLPLLLAPLAVLNWWRSRSPNHSITQSPVFFFSLLSIFALLFAFGSPLYALIFWLPGISQLHSPFRWVWPLALSVAVLAAYGLEYLENRASNTERRKRATRRWGLVEILAWGAMGGGVLTLLALSLAWWQFARLENFFNRLVPELALASQAFNSGAMFFSYTAPWAALFAATLLASGAVLRLSQSSFTILGRPAWKAAAIGVLAVDLIMTIWGFNPASDPKLLEYVAPSAKFLQQDASLWRYTSFDPTGQKPYNANVGWYYNFQDVRGYDSLFTRQYADYMKLINPQYELDFNRIAPLSEWDALNSPLLDLLNVKYVVSVVEIPNNKYTLVFDGEVKIYRNEAVMPRAYTLPQTATLAVDDFAQAVQQFNPREYAMVAPPDAGGVQFALPAAYAEATVTSYQNNTVFVDAAPAEPSWLILLDAYDAGWKAYVREIGAADNTEKEVPLVRINGNFRGVRLEAGEWTVRFRYTPVSVRLGGIISLLTGITLVFFLGVWLWRYFYQESKIDSTARRIAKNALAPLALNLMNRAIDMIFAAFMARVLGPEDMGKYYYAIVIFGWFEIISNYGLNTFLTREVSRDRAHAGRYLINTTVLRLWLGFAFIPALAGILGLFFFAPALGFAVDALTTDVLWAIGLLVLAQAPATISMGLSALFYAFEKAEYPAAVATLTTLVKVGLGTVALILGYGFVGLAGASILVNVVTLAVLGLLAWRVLGGAALVGMAPSAASSPSNIDWPLQKSALRESFPLMLNNLLATLFFKVDVTLLKPIRGATEVGWYSVGYKYVDAFNIVPSLFTFALFPLLSRQATQKEQHETLRYTYGFAIKLLTILVLPLAVATTFLAELMVGLLGGAEYLPYGAIALVILAWSMPFGWLNSVTNYVLIAVGQQRGLTRAFAVSVVFNVVLNLIFLPMYGFVAAAAITIASEFFEGLAFYYYVHKHVGRVPWLKMLWRPWLCAGGMALVMYLLWPVNGLLALLASSGAYLAGIILLGAFNAEERATLVSILPSSVRQRLAAN